MLAQFVVVLASSFIFTAGQPLPGTRLLEADGDLAMEMVAGIDRYLMRELAECSKKRDKPTRERLRQIIGAVDERVPEMVLAFIDTDKSSSVVARCAAYEVRAVRWPALDGIDAEGLLLEPKQPEANVVVLPDADESPENVTLPTPATADNLQLARRLAANNCRVLVPVLIDRSDRWSGHPDVRYTNQPHREFVYRAAYEMGRHVIGYEVQKVLAAVDWFKSNDDELPVGVFGYGEGGLIALYSAALDERIDAVVVSGYFKPREDVWREPIYRNVWSLLRSFGDAELLSLVAPRTAIIEACAHPNVAGPPEQRDGRRGAAPGVIETPSIQAVRDEFDRARKLASHSAVRLHLIETAEGRGEPGTDACLIAFVGALGIISEAPSELPVLEMPSRIIPAGRRLQNQFDQLNAFTQQLVDRSSRVREAFWSKAKKSSLEQWEKTTPWYRNYLWNEVIGPLPALSLPPNARTRPVYDEPTWRGYEVMLDVYPDVFAYGILLVPKDLKPDERRPVVVVQHGLEGHASDAIVEEGRPFQYYKAFGRRLAERGFVVYSPQNPYIGWDKFRVLNRKANPLKLSLWSFIVRQNEQTLNWLETLPFVDGERIGFYGLSYGGKAAMRVPAVLHDRFAAVICAGDFNEWIWKMTSLTQRFSYMFTHEYEMYTFNLGNTFNYAELAGLIAPTPFMVERGHRDGVSIDEWVAYEFAKVRRLYVDLGIGDRTEIEYFDGPHQIHGVGTFKFLHKHLNWPEPARQP